MITVKAAFETGIDHNKGIVEVRKAEKKPLVQYVPTSSPAKTKTSLPFVGTYFSTYRTVHSVVQRIWHFRTAASILAKDKTLQRQQIGQKCPLAECRRVALILHLQITGNRDIYKTSEANLSLSFSPRHT